MIEKFNFYDIYGYFVPGAALLAILWIPLGLIKHSWPSSTWTDAVIAAVLAYVLGHILQNVATNAIPSWEVKESRYPSEICLDSSDKELPEACKTQIQKLIRGQFGLELHVNKVGDEHIDKARHNAFLLARQILIQGKAVSYAEQFQGMYALTRGLVSTFALACAYWLGFALAALLKTDFSIRVVIGILTASVLVLANISIWLLRVQYSLRKRWQIGLGYFMVLFIAFVSIGYVLGVRYSVTATLGILLAFFSGWAAIACLRAYLAYKSFAKQFAATIWRDYLAYNIASQQKKPEPESAK